MKDKGKLPIKGGYILQPRAIEMSGVMEMPPATREIWFYILRRVQHKPYKNLKRGEGWISYKDIQNALTWYVGYRKMKYSKTQIAKSLRRLREGNMIETTKATKGLLIKVCNYKLWQNPDNYEGNGEGTHEGTTKETGRQQDKQECNKNDKNEKNDKRLRSAPPNPATAKKHPAKNWLAGYIKIWDDQFGGHPNGGRMASALKTPHEKDGPKKTEYGLKRFVSHSKNQPPWNKIEEYGKNWKYWNNNPNLDERSVI